MTIMIQIRDVPEDVHREIKARAAKAGMTMSDFLKRELERIVEQPDINELIARWEQRRRPELDETPAEMIRAERDSR